MVLPPELIASHYFWLLADRWLQFTFMWVKRPELLWLIIPVWLNWLIVEYFQERKGTLYGNAVTNGFVMFWVGLDSTRTILNEYVNKGIAVSIASFAMIGVMFAYGGLVMQQAMKGKKVAHLLGRIREVTYISTIAIGVINNAVPVDIHTVISLLVFFPVFFIGMEIFLRFLPTPSEELKEQMEEAKAEKDADIRAKQQYQEMLKRKLLLRKKR